MASAKACRNEGPVIASLAAIEEMSSISLKLKVTAIALVSFLMRGCSDIPQSDGDNWTELCKARLDKSTCQADSQCLWVEKDDQP